jgi:superfamily I DNA/RNA helicase
MSFKPSKYQENIFEHFQNSNSNAVIEAVAGSGKTTTLVEAMKLLKLNDVIFVAFNKHIAEEMKKRVPSNVKVATMHSFGYEQLRNVYKKVKLDNNKKLMLLNNLSNKLELQKKQDRAIYIDNLLTLVDLFRQHLCFELEDCKFIANKHQIPYDADGTIILDALFFISEMNKIRDVIDFVDMIYIPAVEDIIIKEYQLVLVDECQDLSTAQIELLKKMVKQDGRIIAVGDRNQSIYGFGGADDESFDKLCNMENTKILPLSISYRCSKKVVQHAQEIVPTIEFSENAVEGSVTRMGRINDINKGDFVLCRLNAPLINLALKLISENKKATIKGIDISSRIMKLLKSTSKNNPKEAISVLWHRYEMMKNNIDDSIKSELNMIYFEDLVNAATALSKDCTSLEQVNDKLSKLFNDDKSDDIVFSTVHKSKGLEANTIHIINPDTLPLRSLTMPWEKKQEQNLHYVAITRAKKNLSYIPN